MTGRITLGLGLALAAAIGTGAEAQSVRVVGTTHVRLVEFRPLVRDSVDAGETEGSALLRQMPDGRVVRCIPGEVFCHDVRPADPVSTVPAVQDLEVGAWGFGEGIRLFGHLRGRTTWGAAPVLRPAGGETFEVLAAYGELDRARFRVRAGRQWQVSGLGFYNFDGAAVSLRPGAGTVLEAYGGRSLVRGLNEPRTGSALAAVEALAPVDPGVLLGARARFRPTHRFSASAQYQVDFRADRRGLHSELAAADAVLRVGGASVEGSLELDVGAGALNQARLRMRPPPVGRVAVHGELRRYRPYFELWTIWGAFSPVGFDEARAAATWAPPIRNLFVRADAAYRSYGDTGTSGVGAFRSDGWGAGANVRWSPDAGWGLDAGYRVEAGFGAARREGQVGIERRFGDAGFLGVHGVAFQRAYEFRLEEGTVLGLGTQGTLRMSDRVRIFADAAVYRHAGARGTPAVDWNQRRASVRMQWTVGTEPVLPVGGGGGR
jgi:hypothetical protein